MLIYTFYNADLIDIAKDKSELSTRFVNDCAFIAVANTLDEAHSILKKMMECPNSSLDWSYSHNSPFELTKLVVMDFARTLNDTVPAPLVIDKNNANGARSQHTITMVDNYKYLGVVFDPKLSWRAHVMKVIAKVSLWTQLLWRITKTSNSLSPRKTHQLYNMVTVPMITYACDIWYTPLYKHCYSRNTRGSVHPTELLQSIQGRATRIITGRLRGTTFDILKVHVNTTPIDLLFRKAQINAIAHISSLPPKHPLHQLIGRATRHFVNRHKSQLHYLTQVDPKWSEIISPVQRHPSYTPLLTTKISPCKDTALDLAQKTHQWY